MLQVLPFAYLYLCALVTKIGHNFSNFDLWIGFVVKNLFREFALSNFRCGEIALTRDADCLFGI